MSPLKNKFADYFGKLNPVQRQVVEYTDGPSLILAGAGSGKTRVLTCRIAYLIQQKKVSSQEILAMTFTKKAANEMKERVAKLTGDQRAFWMGTFHSIFAKILRSECNHMGYPSDFVIYDSEDQEKLIKSILEGMGYSSKEYSARSLASLLSRAKNKLIRPEEYEPTGFSPIEKLAVKIYPEYQKQLRLNHAFDFDDLITVPIQLFNAYPQILQKYQIRFGYVLIDEYQDTNHAQYQLIRLLSNVHRNLCVVGDDDQSIYRWRGADIRNILDFEKDFPDTRVFRLEQNYRSTQNILKAAGSVVEKNKERKGKSLWSEREYGEKLDVIETEDEREEAMAIVEKIKEQVFRQKRTFRDFAVLYRTNAQSRALEDGLRKSGFSYIIVGGVRFYERKEIKDILAYLKLIVNPRDTISLKRIINFPVRGIGDISIQKVERWAVAKEISLFEAMGKVEEIPDVPPRIRQHILSFYNLIQKYFNLRLQISVNELVHTLVDEIGFMPMYKADLTDDGLERLFNIREFLSAIKEYSISSENPNLSGFLEEVVLVSDVDTWNDQSNAVTLMTLHCAKGLEFPVVFITGLEEGLFPISRSLEDPEALEEERRLFYVGITRAMDKACILWAHRRNAYYDSGNRMPSRFLSEMDPEVVEMVNPYSRRIVKRSSKIYPVDFDDGNLHETETAKMHHLQSTYRKGIQVSHEIFGRGTITRVDGNGDKQKVTVHFISAGEKKFISKYVRFKILD